MATIQQLDAQITKLNVEKDKLVLKANQFDVKLANLRKALSNATNNPQQADNIKKQMLAIMNQKRAVTGVDFDVNEDVDVMAEDGEAITTGSYAGAELAMPLGWKKNEYLKDLKSKKKMETVKIPVLQRRDGIAKVNNFIDNLGGN